MAEYRTKSGLTLADNMTGWGWEITSASELILALEGLPGFATVATAFIVEALGSAINDKRTEFKDVQDLADTLNKYYL